MVLDRIVSGTVDVLSGTVDVLSANIDVLSGTVSVLSGTVDVLSCTVDSGVARGAGGTYVPGRHVRGRQNEY